MVESHWTYNNKKVYEVPEGMVAFVYQITNTKNGMMYIGKKNFFSTRMLPPLKGKSRRRKKVIESKWKEYTGSSDYLNDDIKIFGKSNFIFEILEFNVNKSENNYSELVHQVMLNVLDAVNETGDRMYYNKNINLKYYPSEKHREKRNIMMESF